MEVPRASSATRLRVRACLAVIGSCPEDRGAHGDCYSPDGSADGGAEAGTQVPVAARIERNESRQPGPGIHEVFRRAAELFLQQGSVGSAGTVSSHAAARTATEGNPLLHVEWRSEASRLCRSSRYAQLANSAEAQVRRRQLLAARHSATANAGLGPQSPL